MRGTSGGSIMVAVENVDRSAAPLIKKAAALARRRGAGLQLLHVIAIPYVATPRAGISPRAALREAIRERAARLEKLARISQLRGLEVKTTVVWDYPASDAIVRQVMKYRPAMLMVRSQRHARLARLLLTNTDWELIRNCPCPVLLSKTDRSVTRPRVVASLDPFHAHAKPAGLDAIILETAIDIAGSKRRTFAVHAHEAQQLLMVEAVHEPYWVTLSEHEQNVQDTQRRAALEAEASRFEVPRTNVIFMRGAAQEEIPGAAKRLRADLVVMGAVSRSGLKRMFIGNTAERLLDRLPCDVLVVKPRRFATVVPRRQASLLPYPPYPAM